MNVTIKTIPHSEQRYMTTGDYVQKENGDIEIYISEVGDWKSEMLVAVHELMEVLLVIARDIPIDRIDEFDMAHPELEDPGMDERAPYHREHVFATAVEMILCQQLGKKWLEHNKLLESLYTSPSTPTVAED